MLLSTFLNLAITPILYIVIKSLAGRRAATAATDGDSYA
jgi:hypothetical protein